MVRFALLAAALALHLPLLANDEPPTPCLIVGISDGDTVAARCGTAGEYEQVKIRIAAIDAPEKRQPFGERSRQSLAKLCHMQNAAVFPRERDRYGRTVADVECRGQDVGTHQVANGMAWVYERYAKVADAPLYRAQDAARQSRAGLWRDAEPVAPWEWRKERRQPRP
jgi:endonuclease YncB( thermonuclease family)